MPPQPKPSAQRVLEPRSLAAETLQLALRRGMCLSFPPTYTLAPVCVGVRVKTMYNAAGANSVRAREYKSAARKSERSKKGWRWYGVAAAAAAAGSGGARGGSTQFIKESTARNLRLLLTLGCRNLCELLIKEWRLALLYPPLVPARRRRRRCCCSGRAKTPIAKEL